MNILTKSVAAVALLALPALLPSTAVQAGVGDLLVAPTRLVLDGRKGAEIILNNIGDDVATYRISVEFRRMLPDGTLEDAVELTDSDKAARDMIVYAPRRVTLAPNEPQSIRINARPPEGPARRRISGPHAVPGNSAGNARHRGVGTAGQRGQLQADSGLWRDHSGNRPPWQPERPGRDLRRPGRAARRQAVDCPAAQPLGLTLDVRRRPDPEERRSRADRASARGRRLYRSRRSARSSFRSPRASRAR